MIRNRFITRIGALIIALAVIFSAALMYGADVYASDVKKGSSMEYETGLFDTDRVHTIDISLDEADWEKLQSSASEKEYYVCSVTIDGKTLKNVAIRAKGNSSLSTVKSQGSERYSLKIEFDHYSEGQTFEGLDKLSLNNIVGDDTYMKDFLSYTLMRKMGVESPLCSYIYISVNGEEFGLYLAVEGIEESFAERSYGYDYGDIYKPDSMDMNDKNDGEKTAGAGGQKSTDVALKYQDDDTDSYSHIFDNSITKTSKSDKERLVSVIKQLNEGENLGEIVDVEEVLKYFVVHGFVCNFDSYTGSMMHNYYLHEKDGKISIIAWDYNLAFGAFSMGGVKAGGTSSSVSTATSFVNFPIDTPVSGTTMEDRPLLNQLLKNYMELYHEYYEEFIEEYFDSGYVSGIIDSVRELIAPYVEKDPTKFCTYDKFKKAADTLKSFCGLRAESVKAQLEGSIASTSEGQKESSSNLVDASGINLSDMGTFGGGGRGIGGGEMGERTLPQGEINRPRGEAPPQNGEASVPAEGNFPGTVQGSTDTPNIKSWTSSNTQGVWAANGRDAQSAANGLRAGGFPPSGKTAESSTLSNESLIYLGASFGLVILASLWARLTKRKKWH